MSITVPDQALMAEAADLIQELRAKVASLEASVLEERAARHEAEKISDSFIEQAAEGSQRQEDEIAKLENRVEWLEEDRKRLSALVHPDTPGCDVVAGKCHWCDSAVKRRDEDVRALCAAVTQLMPTSRTLKPLVEKVQKGLE